ncbi:IclR family transcriptional regulator [Halopiger thermotolerans]
MESQRGTGRTIRSVEISFKIIESLKRKGGAGVTELATELEHSKSTIHSHLGTLEDLEIAVKEDDQYRLSLRILNIAQHVREQIGNYDVIRKEVKTLARDTGEIAQFGIEEHSRVSYLCKAAGDDSVETASSVGTQQPIHSTALGKTICAYLPRERVDEIVSETEFLAQTENTIATAEEFYEELEAIRERGYGIDDEENIDGLRCVAAPVRNGEDVLGAISVSGPSSRFTDERLHGELADYVQGAANVVERNTNLS